ncbi:unnamed protein product, partial [Rotaria sp. Silwood2]
LNEKFVKAGDDHTHSLEKRNIEVREFYEKVEQRAINETASIPRIYNEEYAKAMPSLEQLRMLHNADKILMNGTFSTCSKTLD